MVKVCETFSGAISLIRFHFSAVLMKVYWRSRMCTQDSNSNILLILKCGKMSKMCRIWKGKLCCEPGQKIQRSCKERVSRFGACVYYLFACGRFSGTALGFNCLWTNRKHVTKLRLKYPKNHKLQNKLFGSTLNSTVDSVGKIHWNLLRILVIPHSATTNYSMWLLKFISVGFLKR